MQIITKFRHGNQVTVDGKKYFVHGMECTDSASGIVKNIKLELKDDCGNQVIIEFPNNLGITKRQIKGLAVFLTND